jgi:hypothetical protein
LEEGDMIIGINGVKLKSPSDWNAMILDELNDHDDDVLMYGAAQSGQEEPKLQLKLKPEHDHEHIITLHIRDWRTGKVYLRKTNLNDWN